MIKFLAHSGGARISPEGEVKLVLVVPANGSAQALAVTQLTEDNFVVEIKREEMDRNSDI